MLSGILYVKNRIAVFFLQPVGRSIFINILNFEQGIPEVGEIRSISQSADLYLSPNNQGVLLTRNKLYALVNDAVVRMCDAKDKSEHFTGFA